MTDILTIEENKAKVFSQEEWNDLEKWMDDFIASGKKFRDNNPV